MYRSATQTAPPAGRATERPSVVQRERLVRQDGEVTSDREDGTLPTGERRRELVEDLLGLFCAVDVDHHALERPVWGLHPCKALHAPDDGYLWAGAAVANVRVVVLHQPRAYGHRSPASNP